MVFTKREKIIIAATIAAVSLLVVDFYVLTPVLGRCAAVRTDRERLLAEMARARSLLERRQLLTPKWRKMLDDGMKDDPAKAESQILRALRNWSHDVGVKLLSLRPERSTEKTELREITIHVAGTGSMEGVSRLLWGIETTRAPVKIKMLQLGARKDGTDDLSLQLKISTLYVPPACPVTEQAPQTQRPGGGDR